MTTDQERYRVRALARMLRKHGTSLHRDTIAAIALNEANELFGSSRSVATVLSAHPDVFREIDDGVYELASFDIRPSALSAAKKFARYGWYVLDHEYDDETAELAFRRCLKRDVTNVAGHFGLARVLIRQRRFTEAAGVVNWLTSTLPEDVTAARIAARLFELTERWDLAIDEWQRVVRAEPQSVSAHIHLAISAIQAYEPAVARRALSQALEVDDESVEALLLLAQLEFDDERREEAVALVLRASQIDEQYVRDRCPGALLSVYLEQFPERRSETRPRGMLMTDHD